MIASGSLTTVQAVSTWLVLPSLCLICSNPSIRENRGAQSGDIVTKWSFQRKSGVCGVCWLLFCPSLPTENANICRGYVPRNMDKTTNSLGSMCVHRMVKSQKQVCEAACSAWNSFGAKELAVPKTLLEESNAESLNHWLSRAKLCGVISLQ